jgi:septum formation protein
MLNRLQNKHIILASRSPRRRYLLHQLGLEFTEVSAEVDESYPEGLWPDEVARYIAEKKAAYFDDLLKDGNNVVITADTLVVIGEQIIGKPEDREHAIKMLKMLSGRMHRVVTGVTICSQEKKVTFTDWTDVHFKELSDDEIGYYVDHFHPYDKAGAYGAQEWIGYIAITRIDGSYFNVMGLPVQRLYEELSRF